jgi:thiamine pyrophosphokinase
MTKSKGWNYRIIKHINENCTTTKDEKYWYAIHEVYYDKHNKPYMCTVNPSTITALSKKELKWTVKKIKKAIKKIILNENIFNEKTSIQS